MPRLPSFLTRSSNGRSGRLKRSSFKSQEGNSVCDGDDRAVKINRGNSNHSLVSYSTTTTTTGSDYYSGSAAYDVSERSFSTNPIRSSLKVKTQSDSLRKIMPETSLLDDKQLPLKERRVAFDQVKLHCCSFALAGHETVPAELRFGEPPFFRLGECFQSKDMSVDDFEEFERAGMSSLRWGAKHRHKNSSKLQPLRVYARERILQKAGYSIDQIRESVVTFNRIRYTPKEQGQRASFGRKSSSKRLQIE